MPYLEITVETGFESLSYFSRIFKKVTGVTPKNYRQHHQSMNPM
jgi:AraC-like DNA-binding protein